jgi:hypothetical protein
MIIWLSLLVAVIGMMVYVLSSNPKVAMLGLIAYGGGLLAFLQCVCQHGSALGIVAR